MGRKHIDAKITLDDVERGHILVERIGQYFGMIEQEGGEELRPMTLFVTSVILLARIMLRYNIRANPVAVLELLDTMAEDCVHRDKEGLPEEKLPEDMN